MTFQEAIEKKRQLDNMTKTSSGWSWLKMDDFMVDNLLKGPEFSARRHMDVIEKALADYEVKVNEWLAVNSI